MSKKIKNDFPRLALLTAGALACASFMTNVSANSNTASDLMHKGSKVESIVASLNKQQPQSNELDKLMSPQIVTVASKVALQAKMSSNNANTLNSQNNQRIVIRKSDASFIKVHFSQFLIPDGSYVEVRSKDGTQVHRYGSGNTSLKTQSAENGDNGVTRFSALSIIGDTAIVEYFPGTNSNESYEIAVDHIMQGFPQEEIEYLMQVNSLDDVEGRSTCGVNERRDVQCWANSHPTEFERTRPVARLLINGSGLCTAWRVGSQNHMFTNNHCVETQSELTNTEVWFNYQRNGCGGGGNASTTIVTGQNLLKTDYTLDYTLFSVNNFSSIGSFGYFGLDVRNAVNQEQIYIPQHGSGNPKELAIESDQNSGGVCRIDDVLANGRGSNTDMGYLCDTIGGSSGSPVLASSSNRVLALHHFGGCNNQGVRIANIWPQVSSYFGGVIPSGDNEDPAGDPSANFSYTLNGSVATFTNSSTDANGNIISNSWDFGDGSGSSAQNPTHTYSADGNYTVSLTVTDNDGLTDSTSQQVQISSTPMGQLEKGQPVSNLSGNQGITEIYWIDVPANSSNLTFDINGGSGDADLYVRFGAEPTTSTYDCRPYRNGNVENCIFSSPQAGRYYVMLRAYSTYSGVELVANYSDATGGTSFEDTNVSGTQGSWKHYSLEVAAGTSELNASITGGSGDADLYVRFGAEPTTSSYSCRPYRNGNEETCTESNPQAGTWYISVRAYRSFSGLTIRGEAQ